MSPSPFLTLIQRLGGRPVPAAALAAQAAHFRQTVLPRIVAQQKAKAQGAHDVGRKVLF